MEDKEKARIVIEVSKDDYEALLTIKNLLSISWRDLIIAGAIWWTNEVRLEERIENIREQVYKLKNS